MWERRPKVSPVEVTLPYALGVKDIVAFGAEQVDSIVSRKVGEAGWEDSLAVAKNSRAATKIFLFELIVHGVHPAVCNNVAGVDQPVKHLAGLSIKRV